MENHNSSIISRNIEKDIDTSGIMVLEYPHFQAISIGAKDCKAPITSTIQGDIGVIVINKPINQISEYTLIDNDGSSRHNMNFLKIIIVYIMSLWNFKESLMKKTTTKLKRC